MTMRIAAAATLAALLGCSDERSPPQDRTAPRLVSRAPDAAGRIDETTPALFVFDEAIGRIGGVGAAGGDGMPDPGWPLLDGRSVAVPVWPGYLVRALDPRAFEFQLQVLGVADVAGNATDVAETFTFVDGPPLDVPGAATSASLALGPGGRPAVAWTVQDSQAWLARWSEELLTHGDYAWDRGDLPWPIASADAVDLATTPEGALVLAGLGGSRSVEVFEDGLWGFETRGLVGVDVAAFDVRYAPGGALHVAWTGRETLGAGPRQLRVARRDADVWTALGAPAPESGCATAPSLAFDRTGYDLVPVAAYAAAPCEGGATTAHVVRWSIASWQDLPLPQTALSGVPTIAADASGTWVAVRQDQAVRVLRRDGAGWTELGDATAGDLAQVSSAALALDASGVPVVAYAGAAGARPLGVRRLVDGSWAPVAGFDALLPGTAATVEALETDASGGTVLAWREQDPGARSRLYVRRVPLPP
ncbi:MAG TPA: hypothetical protein VFL83_19345 [Anaeromyxobacter sp.]|nr:hypothetical protein [Anaeromyxobacter sp.]